MYDWQTIQEELLTDVSAEMVRTYLRQLIKYEVVDWREQHRAGGFGWVEVNDQTELFLKAGGFKSIFDRQEAENKRLADNQIIEDAKLRSDARLSKLQADHFWKIFGVAFIGGVAGLFTLVLELEDRGYISLPIELRKDQSGKDETLDGSTDKTKEAVQYSNSDTLK